ncbi:MAG: type II secretion system protein [Armatimonadota bacterium]
MKSKGLTLVELLIVIGIIVILFALGYSSFTLVRKSAHITVCRSNLKQVGAALLAYEEDWGAFPPTLRETVNFLTAYLKTDDVLVCPSRPTVIVGGVRRKAFGYFYATYVFIPGKGKLWQIPKCVSPLHLRGTPEEPIVMCPNHGDRWLVCDEGFDVPTAVADKTLIFRRDGSVVWAKLYGAKSPEEYFSWR